MTEKLPALLQSLTFLKREAPQGDGWSRETVGGRDWESLYRNRWQHDKVVRSTHGVNCTGSCSWKIHVKGGIITWETQQTDYPCLGANSPDYEPRGCARGASFSWYEYSPLRVRYPYVRAALLALWRQAKAATVDPVSAWEWIVSDPERKRAYQAQRGKGGLVRAEWAEVVEMVAAATIHTIKQYGPDRVVGFSPIPAMSMVSYAGGSRFLSLIGGTILSFYDWYADLPIASPQIWGDQTDVPESADWYNADYMIIWGSNLPMTRTPDAHFMVEGRYRGLKVAAVSPDYAEYVKFADTWLPAKVGTDAALAMAMQHVILKEYYVEHPTEYFLSYAKKYSDLPFLVRLEQRGDGFLSDRFLSLADLAVEAKEAAWKTLVWDEQTDGPVAPGGSLGHRWDGSGKWNLHLEDGEGKPVSPALTMLGREDRTVPVDFPYFGAGQGEAVRRHVPVKELDVDGRKVLVTTVYDLLLAHVGVGRGLPGDYPADYDDPRPYTPAWQEKVTGVDRRLAIRVAREFAETAARTKGRSMVVLGAGVNHWFHSDATYRAIIGLVLVCGCQGVNGGGWAHYVGQEKVRPVEGWSALAFASDWLPGTRLQNGTSFFYFATDQFRYDSPEGAGLSWPGGGKYGEMHPADMNALAVRMGWLPFYPQFGENSLTTIRKARSAGAATDADVAGHVARRLVGGDLQFAVDRPDDTKHFPRVMFVWRANLLGASAKGHEHFLTHLLGTDGHVLADAPEQPPLEWVDASGTAPVGKLDLLVNMDFRMTGTALYSDIVLPAATWYEKHDISSTDMHPFIHPFNPAVSPPWEAKSDWETFVKIAEAFSALAKDHLPEQEDLLMAPLLHDSPAELAQPGGKIRDWRKGETEAIPGKTMPRFVPVKRDYPHIYEQMVSVGPRVAERVAAKGLAIPTGHAYEELQTLLGASREAGPAQGRPSIRDEVQFANAILTLSGSSNGKMAVAAWKALEKSTGLKLEHVAKGREDETMHFGQLTTQPRLVISTPVWSGLEEHGRRYSPFTSNVELEIPWRTLTGRQHFYLDHELILDVGEGMAVYRPPLVRRPFPKGAPAPAGTGSGTDASASGDPEVTVRFITPHGKWSIHSTYGDTLPMLTLFRGGPCVWMSQEDAERIGVRDNDWVEVFNRNGAAAVRAVVTHRLPEGLSIMYHAQDRTIAVPKSRRSGGRGGTHNSLARVVPKLTHMIGGYAQLSWSFNYYGPTGHQRDEFAVIRPLREVDWLED